MMRSFDGHCDTLARCLERGSALRQNAGHVDLTRCAALGQWNVMGLSGNI